MPGARRFADLLIVKSCPTRMRGMRREKYLSSCGPKRQLLACWASVIRSSLAVRPPIAGTRGLLMKSCPELALVASAPR